MCRLGCRTELLQSSARAKVPTDLGREADAAHWSQPRRGGRGQTWTCEGRKHTAGRGAGDASAVPRSQLSRVAQGTRDRNRGEDTLKATRRAGPRGPDSPGHHQELVDLLVYERVVRLPHLGLQRGLVAAVLLPCGDGAAP